MVFSASFWEDPRPTAPTPCMRRCPNLPCWSPACPAQVDKPRKKPHNVARRAARCERTSCPHQLTIVINPTNLWVDCLTFWVSGWYTSYWTTWSQILVLWRWGLLSNTEQNSPRVGMISQFGCYSEAWPTQNTRICTPPWMTTLNHGVYHR